MNQSTLFAHSNHSLAMHPLGVAAFAEEFTNDFDASEQGKISRLFHDLGKTAEEFQKRITHATGKQLPDGEKQLYAHHGASLF